MSNGGGPRSGKPARIAIVDDHTLVASMLCRVLAREPDFAVVGLARDGAGARELVRSRQPDVVLLDVCLPDTDGIALIPELRRISPDSKILVVTGFENSRSARRALAAGASGYLSKTSPIDDLCSAIRTVRDGQALDGCAIHAPPAAAAPSSLDRLSERECEVLRLIALGHTNREIAELLAISSNSVATYRARICEKLELDGRADMVRFALDHGLLGSGAPAELGSRR